MNVLLMFSFFLPITQPRSKQTPVVGSCFHGQSTQQIDYRTIIAVWFSLAHSALSLCVDIVVWRPKTAIRVHGVVRRPPADTRGIEKVLSRLVNETRI